MGKQWGKAQRGKVPEKVHAHKSLGRRYAFMSGWLAKAFPCIESICKDRESRLLFFFFSQMSNFQKEIYKPQ